MEGSSMLLVNGRSDANRAKRSTSPVVLPPELEAEGTRRRILEGALRLFASQGFHAASMRDLARTVELQASALYVHFPSKEHLLAELVRVGHEVHHQALRAALLDAGNDPIEQLRGLVAAHIRSHATYPHLAIIVNTELDSLSPELAAPGLVLRAQSASLLAEVIARGVSLRRFDPPDRQATAAAISAMGLRLPYWYQADGALDLETLVATHVELALRMVGATR
jgi:AcrR family transcriptional regulator